MSYEKRNLADVEPREIDGIDPALRAVGYELQPEKMRPSVWEFKAGESNDRHHQREQEELYVVLDGRLEMEIDDETFTVVEDDYIVVSPDSWRRLTAKVPSQVFVVGAPNVRDDAIDEEDIDKETA